MFTLLTFLFFTGLVAGLTYLLTRGDNHRTSDGYFLGGRSLSAGFIAGSLVLTNLSTEQLVGLNGSAYLEGLSVMVWEIGACVALVFMALFFLPRFLRRGITTVPEFLESRFGPSTAGICSLIFIAAYALLLLPIILYSGAIGLSTMLDLRALTGIESEAVLLWSTVILVGTIGSIYAVFGGLRTIAVSDTMNGFGLLVGGCLITFFGLRELGGEGGVASGWATLLREHPERMNSIGGPTNSVPFHALFSGVLILHTFYWCTNQQIIQRTLGARNLREGQKGVLLAGFLKLFGPVILVLPGIIAFHLYAAEGVRADAAYGTLVSRTLPPVFTGFFAAAMIGAILSSFNSALNSTATLFSLGVYAKVIRPDAPQEAIVRSGRWASLAIALFAMLTAPLLAGQPSLFTYLQAMNAVYFIPLLAVVVSGLVEQRSSAFAANVVLVVSLVVMALEAFVFTDAVSAHLHHFHFIAVVFVLAVSALVVSGRFFPRRVVSVPAPPAAVDLSPWKPAPYAAAILLLAVFALYLSFADFSVWQ